MTSTSNNGIRSLHLAIVIYLRKFAKCFLEDTWNHARSRPEKVQPKMFMKPIFRMRDGKPGSPIAGREIPSGIFLKVIDLMWAAWIQAGWNRWGINSCV
jgi:hypothetical protein